jgi:hypothetical protein
MPEIDPKNTIVISDEMRSPSLYDMGVKVRLVSLRGVSPYLIGILFLIIQYGILYGEPVSITAHDQLLQLLRDRPQLIQIVHEGNPLWEWLLAAFQPDKKAMIIKWSGSPLGNDQGADAESSPFPNSENISYIYASSIHHRGSKIGFAKTSEELLSDIVFEIYNVKLGPDKKQVEIARSLNKLDKKQYIISCAYWEYKAEVETSNFFLNTWIPLCQVQKTAYSPKVWHYPCAPSFKQWLQRYPEGSWYPWKYYGDRFDSLR